MLYAIVDYDSFELKAWAQVCLWTVGESRLASVLNFRSAEFPNGRCPHTELGARLAHISTEAAYAIRKGKLEVANITDFDGTFRQTAKIGNFGLPGGMGPATLKVQARKEYRVKLSLGECETLRDAWREQWPEARAYFRWAEKQDEQITCFRSGRIRGGLGYCQKCNTPFQGLAADAAKDAGWRVTKECYTVRSSPLYGCRVPIFAHDELVVEVPEDERRHAAAFRLRDIMVQTAQEWMPDVTITAEPALARRYSKEAKAYYNAQGILSPWEDRLAA